MPEVSTLFSGVQIGDESTLGTEVDADKVINYLGIDIDPAVEFARFRPMGQAVAGGIVPSQISSTASVSGQASYSELVYPFSSIYGATTPTTVDTSARRWAWDFTGRSAITPKSFTVEHGDSTRAGLFTGGVFNGVELTFSRTGDGIPVGGSMIGQQYQDNITLTGSPTTVEDKPIVNKHVNVYLDSTSGGLGTTKLTRDFTATFRHTDAFGAIWPINSANSSWANVVNTEPTVQLELVLAADTQGMARYTEAVDDNSTQFIRINATSTELAGAASAYYDFQLDFAGKVSSFGGFDDVDGLRVATFVFDAVYDGTWGKALSVRVTNKVTAL